jgi:hypothetical protein
MSDDVVKRLQANGDVLRHIEAQAAEITRLRAELATAQVEALKKAAEIARQFAQSEGWSGTSALRLRNCIIAEAAIYTKTGGKDE